MKKLSSKILCSVLCLGFAFSAAACSQTGKPNNPTGSGSTTGGKDIEIEISSGAGSGIHNVSVSEGTVDFITNGELRHEIVVPSNADDVTTFAATELSSFVLDACGVRMEIVTEDGRNWSADSMYFVLGAENSLFEKAGVNVPTEKLSTRGAYVETKGKSVFLAGATSAGTLNAVYEWLHYQLNWEIYGTEEIVQLRGVTDMKLKVMNILEVPDIDDINSSYGWTDLDFQTCRRLRFTGTYWMGVGEGSLAYHNAFEYLPPKTYKSAHPDWYSTDGTQLCYMARGNEAERQLMIDTVTEVLKKESIEHPTLTHVTLTQMDNRSWCACPACVALNEKYGTDAVTTLYFCNEVSRRIQAWYKTAEGLPYARELKIMFFAYHPTQYAPTKYDSATDTYSPIDDTVICDDNVGIIYAPITASYQVPLSDERNRDYYETVRAWAVVTNNICMWTYSTNFRYYLIPTNTYNTMQENYRFFSQNGTKWLLDQAQYAVYATGFSALKMYLNTKLAWNVNYDLNALINDYFANYFGPAASGVRQYFDELRAHWAYLEQEMGFFGNTYLESHEREYWPDTLLKRWEGYIGEALAALESIKDTDRNAYNMYRNNVLLESISVRFLLLDLWASAYGDAELTTLRNAFREDCAALGLTRYSEHADLSTLWTQWGI